MITIDQEKCNGCRLCAEICHEHCMTVIEETVRIDLTFCSTCMQCIAICPRRALSWDGVPPSAFDRARLPSADQVDELLRQRRTVRRFKPERIDRALLEEIINAGVFAPKHAFNLRAVVVEDGEIIELADRAIQRFNKTIYRYFYRPRIVAGLMRRLPPVLKDEYLKAKPKLEAALGKGGVLVSRPAALVFVVGDKRIPLSLESAQYVLYNICLFAQVKGVGSRNLVGNQMMLNRSRSFRRRLGLARKERIFGFVGLGYPAVRFSNKVQGRKMDIQWSGKRFSATMGGDEPGA